MFRCTSAASKFGKLHLLYYAFEIVVNLTMHLRLNVKTIRITENVLQL